MLRFRWARGLLLSSVKLSAEFRFQRRQSNLQRFSDIGLSRAKGDHCRDKSRGTISDAFNGKHFHSQRAGQVANVIWVGLCRPTLKPMVLGAVSQQVAVAHAKRGTDFVKRLTPREISAPNGVPIDGGDPWAAARTRPNTAPANTF
jgi:hypothetical protein